MNPNKISTPTSLNSSTAKPFLKWAGGKSQLLPQFKQFYPQGLKTGKIVSYIEPFLGGGAVFFNIINNYRIDYAYLCDINEELILVYKVVQQAPHILLEYLSKFNAKYKSYDEKRRHDYFYETRKNYNSNLNKINLNRINARMIERSAQMIFLNKTCFNGLFRLNRKGEFNVPFGRYKNPKICDEENINKTSQKLQIAEIELNYFTGCEKKITDDTFVYFDPPYRPISKTSSFTSYSKFEFADDDQIALSNFFAKIDNKCNAKLMLSNSDPKNENPQDNFFEELYRGYNINKVTANRMINRDAAKRGAINELLITNY